MEIKYKHLEGYCKLIPNNIINNNKLINEQNLKIKIENENNKTDKYSTGYNTTKNKLDSKIKTFRRTTNLSVNKNIKKGK